MTPRVSLVLATVGRCDDLIRMFDSLAAQSLGDFELIVVDQNPDARLDAPLAHAAALGLSLRHLRLDRPNLSAARNCGIKAAQGEIIAFPDDDCWYEPDVLTEVAAAFDALPARSGVVARWVEQMAGQAAVPASGEELALAAWRDFRGGNASSITLFFRRSVFERLGGFDERFGVGRWYGAAEETDLMLRVLGAGMSVVYWPSACVHHAFGRTKNIPLGRLWHSHRQRERGSGALYAKHRMSSRVVLRGLCSPLIKPWFAGSLRGVVLGWASTLGRLEGMLGWLLGVKA